MKKLLSFLMAVCLMFSLGTTVNAADDVAEVNGTKYTSIKNAVNAAVDGDIVKLLKDVEQTDEILIEKAITLDLNDKTLTITRAYAGVRAKGNCSIVNGKYIYNGNVAAIRAWAVKSIEDLEIVVNPAPNKTTTGIALQEGSSTYVESIKNVKISGASQGIELLRITTNPAFGVIDNVKIDATNIGLTVVSAIGGTVKNSNISGDNIGINLYRTGNYSVGLTVENSKVSGETLAVYVHDEKSEDGKEDYNHVGTMTVNLDENTTYETNAEVPVQSELGEKSNATVEIETKSETGICEEVKEDGTVKYHMSHKFASEWTSSAEGHYHLCEVCGAKDKIVEHDTKLINVKKATCTDDGYTGDEYCETCEKTLVKGNVVKATGHTFKDGKCSVCGEKEKAPETGDTTNVLGLLAMLLGSAFVISRKRFC